MHTVLRQAFKYFVPTTNILTDPMNRGILQLAPVYIHVQYTTANEGIEHMYTLSSQQYHIHHYNACCVCMYSAPTNTNKKGNYLYVINKHFNKQRYYMKSVEFYPEPSILHLGDKKPLQCHCTSMVICILLIVCFAIGKDPLHISNEQF